LNKQYLVNILNSDFGIRLMMDNQFDTGRGNLSLGAISKFKIPFPPLAEQKSIVEKVKILMVKCQALEQEIKTSETNAQMLMQAVLKEAFEGKQEVVEV
jgi:type I restriction enzyme S subunit